MKRSDDEWVQSGLRGRGHKVRSKACLDLADVTSFDLAQDEPDAKTVALRRNLGLPPVPRVTRAGQVPMTGIIRADVISYRPDPETVGKILAVMKRTGRTRTEIVGLALKAYLSKEK